MLTPRTLARCVAALGLGTALAALSVTVTSRAEDPRDRPYPHGDWQEDCSLCHDDEKFLPAKPTKDFKHAAGLPLHGAHATAACSACHKTLDFAKPPRPDCVECHQDVHRGEFGADCARCHTPRTFIDRAKMTSFHRTTRFPLSGAHAAADCEGCHRPKSQGQLTYVGLATDCAGCHDDPAFPSAPQRPPSHVEGDYSLDCSLCHNTVSFLSVRFDHGATGFPLTGTHASLECTRCHGEPFDPNLSPECVSCHLADYQATTDPSHVEAGFPLDCTLCHGTTAFEGASFDHSATSFPLTGAHIGLACTACHADGVYDGKPTECVSCHLADYQATTDPSHPTAGFSTDCTLCHGTTTFVGARFAEHDALYFPIYSGSHNGVWDGCSDCHTNSANYSVFSCLGCHTQPDTNPIHGGVPGYLYDSAACYACHPRGVPED